MDIRVRTDRDLRKGRHSHSSWFIGEITVDEYGIALDPGIHSGCYVIEIGLCEPTTAERLSVLDGDGDAVADHLILTCVQVGDD